MVVTIQLTSCSSDFYLLIHVKGSLGLISINFKELNPLKTQAHLSTVNLDMV